MDGADARDARGGASYIIYIIYYILYIIYCIFKALRAVRRAIHNAIDGCIIFVQNLGWFWIHVDHFGSLWGSLLHPFGPLFERFGRTTFLPLD